MFFQWVCGFPDGLTTSLKYNLSLYSWEHLWKWLDGFTKCQKPSSDDKLGFWGGVFVCCIILLLKIYFLEISSGPFFSCNFRLYSPMPCLWMPNTWRMLKKNFKNAHSWSLQTQFTKPCWSTSLRGNFSQQTIYTLVVWLTGAEGTGTL